MRFIQLLSSETVSLLRRIYRQSKRAQVRQRAHCILLSNGGFTIAQLMRIFQVSRKTIYNWFTAWEERSLAGLYDHSGRGRKPIFTAEQREQIHRWAQETPKNLNQVLNKIKKTWKRTVSKDTVKRILKGFSMSWRRFRRVLGGSPDPQEYERKERQLEGLKALDDQGIINLVYRAHLRSFGFYEKMLGSVYSKCHGLFKQSDRFRMGNHRASVVGGVASEEEDSSPGLELSRPDGRHLLSPQEWMQLGGLAQRFAPLLNGLLALQTVAGRRDA